MKLFQLRNAFGLSLAVLLAACGAGNPTDTQTQAQTAAVMQASVQVASAATATPTAQATQTTYPVAGANMPQPDCAADGCKALRIIDGNAEAFRFAAMQRAAQAPQS